MKKIVLVPVLLLLIALSSQSFHWSSLASSYHQLYESRLSDFISAQNKLLAAASVPQSLGETEKKELAAKIHLVRNHLKTLDFWLRYLEPVSYKKINGPLPVEWETEVFEKFEKPYRREAAGLSLALQYLDEDQPSKDSLLHLLKAAIPASELFAHDTIVKQLSDPAHFYYCNRLYLLNLAAIYTSGFECPNPGRVIPELRHLLNATAEIYTAYTNSFPEYKLSEAYLALYEKCRSFAAAQPDDLNSFDHYSFIRDFVNPLFSLNQEHLKRYRLHSRNLVDYSLNDNASNIFSKSLYRGQNSKGIFSRVNDPVVLAQISHLGQLLFYDPILSGNNQRSCASCHKPDMYFTDTVPAVSLQFNGIDGLPRNTPGLINAPFNHLLMYDGRHQTLQQQVHAVITNSLEMACDQKDLLRKVLSCREYKSAFKNLQPYTPQEPQITHEHLASAITYYYGAFSNGESDFDRYMNKQMNTPRDVKDGFNLFMGKAQCATCHFVPQFNGVKPPYVGSEFEVLGTPADSNYKSLSADLGRYLVNPAPEMHRAFRTGSLRNISRTAPYMHNGVFRTLDQVIEFYDNGGGAGHGLLIENQTLSADSLHLTPAEKLQLKAFLVSLDEDIPAITVPASLPASRQARLTNRTIKGNY